MGMKVLIKNNRLRVFSITIYSILAILFCGQGCDFPDVDEPDAALVVPGDCIATGLYPLTDWSCQANCQEPALPFTGAEWLSLGNRAFIVVKDTDAYQGAVPDSGEGAMVLGEDIASWTWDVDGELGCVTARNGVPEPYQRWCFEIALGSDA